MLSEVSFKEPASISEVDEKIESPPVNDGFWFNKRETTEGFSIEKGEVIAGETYNRAVEQVMELHGDDMPPESIERLERGVESLDVIDPRKDSVNIGSFSYHNGESRIIVCAIDESQVERTTQHEVNHFASFNREEVITDDLERESTHIVKISGIHNVEYWENSKGEITQFKDLNRGFNEGITQLYTIKQLEKISPEKGIQARRQNGYMLATELAEQVEDAVGSDTLCKAYYGGELSALEEKLDSLGGIGTFERLSRCMDKVTYSRDYSERILSMRDANEILASLMEGGK